MGCDQSKDGLFVRLFKGVTDTFGAEIVEAGTFEMEPLGVQFDLPEGWSGLKDGQLRASATNSGPGAEQAPEDWVIVSFTSFSVTTVDERLEFTPEEVAQWMFLESMFYGIDDIETIGEMEPIYLNGYKGVLVPMEAQRNGEPIVMEYMALEHDNLGFEMVYIASLEGYESEKENFEIIKDSLILTVPDNARARYGRNLSVDEG